MFTIVSIIVGASLHYVTNKRCAQVISVIMAFCEGGL